jgi:ATP-dependent RNA helicase DeaD
MVKKFDEFNIKPVLKNGLKRMNYSTATEVQDESFSVMMGSKNVVVKSFTGSGKTLAFGIPLSERLLRKDSNAIIVIGPTRELVVQVNTELQALNRFTRMRIFPVYGGHGITGEVMNLRKGFEILCATPGRLLDHLERGNLKHIDVDTVVLDEGDLMLDMGFQEDINKILKMVRPRNVHLFSATMEGKVTQVIKEHIKQYELIDIKTEIIGEKILEEEIKLNPEQKFPKLLEYIHKSMGKILIFTSTKRYVEVLKERLDKEGVKCKTIHSDITQARREMALKDFKAGRIKVLIATDVASRGLHIDDVEYVINYDVARSGEIHKHRIGRTGRMGKIGNAVTFVEQRKRRRKDRTDGYMPRHKRDSEENGDGERRRPREDGERKYRERSDGERRRPREDGERRNSREEGERPPRKEGDKKPFYKDGKKSSFKRDADERRYNPNKKLNTEKHGFTVDKKKEKLHERFSEKKEYDNGKRDYSSGKKPEGRFKSTRAKVRSRFSKFKKR